MQAQIACEMLSKAAAMHPYMRPYRYKSATGKGYGSLPHIVYRLAQQCGQRLSCSQVMASGTDTLHCWFQSQPAAQAKLTAHEDKWT